MDDARNFQQDIEAAAKWEQDWLICFHPDKCNIMSVLSIYLCILSQPRKEEIRTGAQMHHAKKKEKINSRIGKIKKLKVMLQKRLKTVKNKCCGLGHEM